MRRYHVRFFPPSRRPGLSTLLIAAAACAPPEATLPVELPAGSLVHASYCSGAICTTENSYLFRKDCWNAGQTITLKVPSDQQEAAYGVISKWNFFLERDASAPRFAVSSSFGDVVVTNAGTMSTNKFCGTFDGDNLSWAVLTDSSSCNQGASAGSWQAALN